METKLDRLLNILYKAVVWYDENLEKQGVDYVYDMGYEQFIDLRRADCVEILAVLSEYKKEYLKTYKSNEVLS